MSTPNPASRMRGGLSFPAGLALASLLAACGGGGGGGSGGSTPPPVQNAPPAISGAPHETVKSGALYDFMPTATDPDGDRLTFTADNLPGWLTLDASTGRLTGTPPLDAIGGYPDITLRVSDGQASATLGPFSITVAAPTLSEADVVTEGTTTPVDTGDPNKTAFVAEGDVELNFGSRDVRLEDSTLQFEFDQEGNLIDLFGETNMPEELTDHVALNADVKARVGLYKGRDINRQPDFGILLQDDFDYLVFFVGVATELEVGDRDNPGFLNTVTLDLPASGEILFILDPHDPFYYRFAGTPLGDAGYGESDNGLIPFEPTQNFPELDSFNGHTIEKGAFSLGVKVFDFFTLEGTRVTRDPQFSDIDWDDPLDSSVEYKSGLNGNASFDFQVLNVGLFSFDLAATSATFDVGFDRQQLAMQTTIAPDVSWQPDWFPILPATSVVGNWFINGDGSFSGSLTGQYRSQLPEAAFSGQMMITPDVVTMSASIDDPVLPLTLAMEFAGDTVTTQIETPRVDIGAIIAEAVDAAFDSVDESIEQAVADLEAAVGSYQGAVSLNGFRSALPDIADTAITVLDGVPGAVRTGTYNGVLSGLRNACRDLFIGDVCASDIVDEVSIANDAANSARSTAQLIVNTRKGYLQDLKAQAQEVQDGPAFRAALKSALQRAADNARLSVTITIEQFIDWPSPIPNQTITVFDNTFNYTILSNTTRDQLLVAAANVDDIDPAYTVMIDTQAIFDALPTKEIVQETREGVQNGIIRIPAFNGAGYTVGYSPTALSLSSFLLIDDERYQIGPANVLSPEELLKAIGDQIVDLLL